MIQNKRSYRMGVATSSIFLLPSNIFTTAMTRTCPLSSLLMGVATSSIFLLPSNIFTTFIRHPGIGPFLVFSLQN